MSNHTVFSDEPAKRGEFTEKFNKFYTQFASLYDWMVKAIPIWRNWIEQAIPYIEGPTVLEVSFGTGYLLTQYANRYQSYGVDYNQRLAQVAQKNIRSVGTPARLQVANVEALPYSDGSFDTVLNTMAFSGYPDGELALNELARVLKKGGRMVVIDINYPSDRNRIGMYLTKGWKAGGDIIRNMQELFTRIGFDCIDKEVGGFGSVHLYVASKPESG